MVDLQQRAQPGTSAATRGLLAGLALLALAVLVPAVTGWEVRAKLAPMWSTWGPRVGPGSLPALLLAALACWRAVDLAQRMRWGRLLVATYAAGLGWMLALAYVDGAGGVADGLEGRYEYLPPAREVTDLPAAVDGFVDRIPLDAAPRNWPAHVAGHPPGALAFFVLLVRLGLGGGYAAGLVVIVLAATTAVAVLVTLRTLGAEQAARRAAPFLVFTPAAIWQAVSADGMFAAVVAWGLALLALAATRRSAWLSVLAGLVLGAGVMLSYGLLLAGVLAVAVLLLAGTAYPLVLAAASALGVVGVSWGLGFSYPEALPVLRERYFAGISGRRPAAYWTWAGPAVLLVSAGPLLGAGVGQTVACWWRRRRELWADRVGRVVPVLVGAALLCVLLADASQMSRAEVERIWLPFVPWLLLGCALLPERWRRGGLVLQVGTALVLQHLLRTGW